MNYKNLLCLSLLAAIPGCNAQQTTIVEYAPSHKDAVMEIAFQDPYNFCCGSVAVTKGAMTQELFISENKKGMQALLESPMRTTKVLIAEGKVAGFAAFYKTQELSLEAMKEAAQSRNIPLDENQILMAMPNLKRTKAECEAHALLETLAVSKEFRGKGYGRALLKHCATEIKAKWPQIKKVMLDVNASNSVARKLYESEGFVLSPIQPRHLVMMECVQYEKSLN